MNCEKIEKLVKKLKRGQKKYFNEFYNLTRTAVYYTIKKVINQRDLIEDVMQDTYVKFVNSLNKIDENANPYSYLLTIAHNQAVDYVKKVQRLEYTDNDSLLDKEDYAELDVMDMPLLSFCKRKLPPDEYKIIELTIVYGYRRVEVANLINEPISTVNWKYNKILKKIKSMYKEVYQNEN